MAEEPQSYYDTIQACEAAITRIRTAIRERTSDSDQVGADFFLIRSVALPRFTHYASWAIRLGPEAEQEALEAMMDQLVDDIWSLTYQSMETGFGAYLKTRPLNILARIRRKYASPGTSSTLERLDDKVSEDGMLGHEAQADPQAEQAFETVGLGAELSQAIAALPQPERRVFVWRAIDDVTNKEVARRLGITEVAATRIYNRARSAIQNRLNPQ